MAFGPNIYFFAPNWEPDVLRTPEPRGSAVPADLFRSWLIDSGFVHHPGSKANFSRELIDLRFHQVDEEVAFTSIEFGLDNDAPQRINDWQTLVDELSDKWGLSLIDQEKREKVPAGQFRRILAEDRIWRIVADVNGWPPIWPELAVPHSTTGPLLVQVLHESNR